MNKTELVKAISQETGTTQVQTTQFVDAFVKAVTMALSKKEKVQLVGFGTFEVRARKARTGTNPKTRAKISIPASNAPIFKAGKTFKEAVN